MIFKVTRLGLPCPNQPARVETRDRTTVVQMVVPPKVARTLETHNPAYFKGGKDAAGVVLLGRRIKDECW